MRVYINNDKNNYAFVQSVASASTMISSVAYEAKKYVLSKFPKNFFKHVYIDTAQTVSEQHIREKYNKTANKIPYPSMGITPEISLDDTIGSMNKGMHLSSPNLYLRKELKRNYRTLVEDPDDKFSIYYTSDYITTNFNFKLVTNSFIQNTDLAFYLQSHFQKDFFQFLNGRYIQSEIPKTFIRAIADIKNWNMNSSTEMDDLRLFLIGTSKQEQSIQKRTNLATGKQCFFINEKQNFLVMFTDLDCPSSINRDAQVESEYTITFRLQISCWLPNAYILSINKKTFERLSDTTQNIINKMMRTDGNTIDNDNDENPDEPEQGFVTAYAGSIYLLKDQLKKFIDNYQNEFIGHLIYKNEYTYSYGSNIPNILLLDKLPEQLVQVYKYGLYKLKLDMSSLIGVYVYSILRGEFENGKEYEFDANNIFEGIKFYDTMKEDIGFGVYVNRVLYETIVEAMKKDLNYFANNHLGVIDLKIGDQNLSAVVKSFVNDNEQYSIDIEKSFRVQTALGPGYISLQKEDARHKSAYKICIGFNENQEPIIRELEIEK